MFVIQPVDDQYISIQFIEPLLKSLQMDFKEMFLYGDILRLFLCISGTVCDNLDHSNQRQNFAINLKKRFSLY